MMSETSFHTPAHPGVAPSPLLFSPVEGNWLRETLPDLAIARVEKADGNMVPAEAGYYRLTLANGQLLFAKVKVGERAAKEAKAAALSSDLNHLGAASLAPDRAQIRRADGLSVFVYPWIEQAFYDESLEGIANLGEALAFLHVKMRHLSGSMEPQKHLFEIWEDRLAMVPAASFGEDYRRLLAGAGETFSRGTSQIAHNDIHRGNVIFDTSNVVAFIDFEDAVETNSSPLVDIAAGLERFCLLPEPSEEKAHAFLASYAKASGGSLAATSFEIAQVGLCRCYHAIAILELSRAPTNPIWQTERRKFDALLEKWRGWEQVIAAAIATLRV